ncbi:MAG TPA: amidohydrolase family protein, partial [Acidimicrobiia bacterium]
MSADLLFVNGPVFTADPARSFARALAVEDGKITAVGSESDVLLAVGSKTLVVDLAGRMLTPGFQDAHCHPWSSGLDLLRCSFANCDNAEDGVAFVARYAADNPESPWILGGGWQQTWFPRGCPPKGLLDEVVPDRPVFLYNADGHGAWANSLALSMAGVDASTVDPPDGRIERDETGEPQGTLHEGAAHLVERLVPDDSPEEMRQGVLAAQRYLLSKGVTAWQDAHVDVETHRAYRALDAAGELIGSAVGAMWWDRNLGLDQIERLEAMRAETSGKYRSVSVKLMLDGVVE